MNKIFEIFKNKKYLCLSFFIVLFIIFLDQISKQCILTKIDYIITKTGGIHNHIKITSFFNLVLVWNKGISFGIFNNSEAASSILFLIVCSISFYLILCLLNTKSLYKNLCFTFMIGGAIGNIIDRIKYGAVIDFLDFHIFNYHWPSFNVADSFVFIGVFLYLIEDLIKNLKIKK